MIVFFVVYVLALLFFFGLCYNFNGAFVVLDLFGKNLFPLLYASVLSSVTTISYLIIYTPLYHINLIFVFALSPNDDHTLDHVLSYYYLNSSESIVNCILYLS